MPCGRAAACHSTRICARGALLAGRIKIGSPRRSRSKCTFGCTVDGERMASQRAASHRLACLRSCLASDNQMQTMPPHLGLVSHPRQMRAAHRMDGNRISLADEDGRRSAVQDRGGGSHIRVHAANSHAVQPYCPVPAGPIWAVSISASIPHAQPQTHVNVHWNNPMSLHKCARSRSQTTDHTACCVGAPSRITAVPQTHQMEAVRCHCATSRRGK